jgi:hypothetical protein
MYNRFYNFQIDSNNGLQNSFTSGHIRFSYTFGKLEMLTCRAHSKSMSAIHFWIFSISEMIIFLLPKKVTTIFIFFYLHYQILALSPSTNFKLSLFHLFYHLLVNVSPHLHQQRVDKSFCSITILKKEEKLSE